MRITPPYLVFLGDVPDTLAAKTAFGIRDWRPDWCRAQMRLPGCAADLGLPEVDVASAAREGVRTFVVGAVNAGGVLPDHWIPSIVSAVEAGSTSRAACMRLSRASRRSPRPRRGTAARSMTCADRPARSKPGRGRSASAAGS